MNNIVDPPSMKKKSNMALKAGMELISGVMVGTFFGYIFDHYFLTKPWGMVGFILLGAITGFYNIFRLVQRMEPKLESDNTKKDRSPL